jgi:hypothetical protein
MPVTRNPPYENIELVRNGIIPAGQMGQTEPLDLGHTEIKTFYIKTSGACTVYFLLGPNANSCTHLLVSGTHCDTVDTARSWSVSNQAKAIQVIEHASYMSVLVLNTSGTDVTFSAWVS